MSVVLSQQYVASLQYCARGDLLSIGSHIFDRFLRRHKPMYQWEEALRGVAGSIS